MKPLSVKSRIAKERETVYNKAVTIEQAWRLPWEVAPERR